MSEIEGNNWNINKSQIGDNNTQIVQSFNADSFFKILKSDIAKNYKKDDLKLILDNVDELKKVITEEANKPNNGKNLLFNIKGALQDVANSSTIASFLLRIIELI